ncbi:acyltransferase [Nitrosococcus halophilus]|nr:acyltransferase [Nitrosococcus halophilus]
MKEIDKNQVIRERLLQARSSPAKAYMDLTVGDVGLRRFLVYEFLTTILGSMPGGFGFLVRKKFYPRLFKNVGNGLILGRNVTIRHPHKITLGNNVTVDDNSVLEGRGEGVVLEDSVVINRNSMLLAKTGPIYLGSRTTIGCNCVLASLGGIELGESVLVAGGCYMSGGDYHMGDTSRVIMDQGAYSKGPIRIGDNVWIGTGAILLDGVTVGTGAVIGAGAVVTRDIPENVIAVGVPARVIRSRAKKD